MYICAETEFVPMHAADGNGYTHLYVIPGTTDAINEHDQLLSDICHDSSYYEYTDIEPWYTLHQAAIS